MLTISVYRCIVCIHKISYPNANIHNFTGECPTWDGNCPAEIVRGRGICPWENFQRKCPTFSRLTSSWHTICQFVTNWMSHATFGNRTFAGPSAWNGLPAAAPHIRLRLLALYSLNLSNRSIASMNLNLPLSECVPLANNLRLCWWFVAFSCARAWLGYGRCRPSVHLSVCHKPISCKDQWSYGHTLITTG